ncbi:MAG TPA: benzoate-CoA ligase family protein [Polyangia bacterium]|nr:benzoate-CoA ligase family protein [Polyangia bacterium]
MPQANLSHLLLDDPLERGRAEAIAIREPKRVWTYAKLAEESCRTASTLAGLGIAPGERVAILLHDSAELAATFLGAVRMGAVPVPLSVLLRPLEVRALVADCAAVAIVVSADLAEAVDSIRGELPSLRHVLAVGGARPGQLDLHALTREAEPTWAAHQAADGAPAFLLYSAGTGGAPRGVGHEHAAPRHAFESYARAVLGLGENDRVFITTSLASAFGLGLGLLFPLQAGAATFLLPTRPRPRAVFDVMAAFKPTIFASTPSLYGQLVHDWRALAPPRPACFESVRHAVSGGEALPATLERRVHATFAIELLHGFGITEALHFVLSNRPGERREASVGRPLPGVEARVVDDVGGPLGVQEIGSLEIRGPTVARGYFGRTDDHGAFHDGWVRPGDRFLVDADGFFYYCGRADDLFKVSGRWVSPDEVERTLLLHPAVWECAVVEGHDEDGLARPVAFVVPNVGHAASAELAKTLMDFVKREIAPYKYPREVEFVDRLPRSPDGKVLRWRLRRREGGPGADAEP